eukprot:Transcript_11787.p1 GENE.Transcript_11787~~Transcript_11787.p1  ORF type:complete len:533 (+),score=199.86 Transcript_11787:229-1827(+)
MSDALAVVAALWAQMRFIRLAVLVVSVEQPLSAWLRPGSSATGALRAATLGSQLVCITFPGPLTFFASLSTTLALGWACLPYEVDNSGTYGLLADLALWCGLAWAAASGQDAADGWQQSAPTLRAIFSTTYAFAALAKLNSDYANVRTSACTVFTLLVGEGFVPAAVSRRLLALLGDRAVLGLLHLALVLLEAVEILIPLLLPFAPLQLAFLVVWAFHLALGSIAYDYSVIAVASLVACAPPAQVVHLAWMSTAAPARLAALALALISCRRLEAQRCRELGSPEHVASLLWLGLLCPVLWLDAAAPTPPGLLGALSEGDGGAPPPPLALSGAVLLLLTVANGLGPYLGYKTVATWAMFSNLHVEGGTTNHWLWPAAWQPFGCCRELATVEATDAARLRTYHTYSAFDATFEGARSPLQAFAARTGCAMRSHANSVLGRGGAVTTIFPYRVPLWQLRRMVSVEVLGAERRKDFFVEYSLPGEKATRRFEVRDGKLSPASDPLLATPPPLLLQKLISFKSVPVDERDCGVCHGP